MDIKVKNKEPLLTSIIIVLLLGIGLCIYNLFTVEEEYESQIESRDSLLRAIQIQDSVLSIKEKQNQTTIDKYISDCNILINGKEVSTEELVKYLNDQIQEIQKLEGSTSSLEDSLQLLKMRLSHEKGKQISLVDSLQIYKTFYTLIKNNKGFDFEIEEQNGTKTIALKSLKTDSSVYYKRVYEFIKQDYGIVYFFERTNNTIVYKRPPNKVDTALAYYEKIKNK